MCSGTIETFQDDMGEAVIEKIIGFVSEKAKPCIAKAIDYTLLVALLLLQFMKCSPATAEDIYLSVQENTFNKTTVYSCDINDGTLLLSSDKTLNGFVLAAIVIGISYGVLVSVIIFLHSSRKGKDIQIHLLTQGLYKCTDKIMVIDSVLEIPISFFWAPMMTIFLWSFFSASAIGLFLMSRLYNDRVLDDENAKAVFSSSAMLVLLSLFKLTGDISQYWVLYTASTSKESRDKFAKSLTAPTKEVL